jgi:hypothetical protein
MRLRILNGTDGILLPLTLPGLEVYVIGQDRINLLKTQKTGDDLKTAIRMAPGNRNKLLIRAPMSPTKSTLQALAQMPRSPNFPERSDGRNDVDAAYGSRRIRSLGSTRRRPPNRQFMLLLEHKLTEITLDQGNR